MSQYVELYKKYRPRSWDTVIGQKSIVESLKTVLKNETVPTAYLFNGPAGTGKTTVAKIMAKALNCENITDKINPCNECKTCKAIDSDSQMGVKYISMSEIGKGAEAVRNIMNEALLSQPVKKQVWILDEVQNLSKEAQDAMLIGLESEKMPSLFILCTTDPEKIKPAILSRVQQKTFSRVSLKELAQHLAMISQKENIFDKVGKEGIVEAVKNSNGSVRTAIGNLELLATDGKLPTNYSSDMITLALNGDVLGVYNLVNQMSQDGQNFSKSLENIYSELVELFQLVSGVPIKNQQLIELSKLVKPTIVLLALNEVSNTIFMMSNKNIDSMTLFSICLSKIAFAAKKSKEK